MENIQNAYNSILWKAQYINLCVAAYAKKHKMQQHLAYSYLREHQAIDFLDKHYEAEHVLALDDTLDSINQICKRNGGAL